MKEQDLIELGFEKVEVYKEESGMDNDYYFYAHTQTGIDFFSSADYEANSDDWWVSMFENDSCKIFSKTEIELIIHIINKNTIKRNTTGYSQVEGTTDNQPKTTLTTN